MDVKTSVIGLEKSKSYQLSERKHCGIIWAVLKEQNDNGNLKWDHVKKNFSNISNQDHQQENETRNG